jgi:hypothetical protein
MAGLFRNNEETREGKYLVTRRDGTLPEWPYFVIGAKDPASTAALLAYADAGEAFCGFDPQFVADVRALAKEFTEYRKAHGVGDPDGAPHREDDPATIEKMKAAKGA